MAITRPRTPSPVASGADGDAILALGKARVGGAFWMPPLAGDRHYVAWVRAPGDAMASAIRITREHLGADGAVLTTSLDGSRVDHPGVDEAPFDGNDPWSVLDRCDCVVAPADDEIHVLAAAAGRTSYVVDSATLVPAAPLPEIAAARLTTCAFRSPFNGGAIDVFGAIDILSTWRRGFDANAAIVAGFGIARWKRDEVARMTWAGHGPLPMLRTAGLRAVALAGRTGGTLIHWPSRSHARDRSAARANDLALAQVEDGFIRSRGLGSDCYPPLSIVVDRRGIYYDSRAPSDLEHLLASHVFDSALIARAERLIDRLVDARVGKYESGGGGAALPEETRLKVLVAGQVEDDLSVLASGGEVTGNLDLLRRARLHAPDAFVIYRPHPDVDAGHRRGAIDDALALEHADLVVRDGTMIGLIERVDAVHVLTSLAGFEALLRRRSVVVHGQPFYAGWGLTTDLASPIARRGRRLTLAELVAATLILYPRYLDPVTRLPCAPEVLLDRLADGYAPPETMPTRFRRFLKMIHTLRGGPRR